MENGTKKVGESKVERSTKEKERRSSTEKLKITGGDQKTKKGQGPRSNGQKTAPKSPAKGGGG